MKRLFNMNNQGLKHVIYYTGIGTKCLDLPEDQQHLFFTEKQFRQLINKNFPYFNEHQLSLSQLLNITGALLIDNATTIIAGSSKNK